MDTKKAIGENLSRMREEKGLTLEQVASQLCLVPDRVKELEALEDIDEVQDVYMRGQLQSYARLLGFSEFLGFSGAGDKSSFQTVFVNSIADEHKYRLIGVWGTFALVTIIAILFAFWLYEQAQPQQGTDSYIEGSALPSTQKHPPSGQLEIPKVLKIPREETSPPVVLPSERAVFELFETKTPQIPAKQRDPNSQVFKSSVQEEDKIQPFNDAMQEDIPTDTRSDRAWSDPELEEDGGISMAIRSRGRCWVYIKDAREKVWVNRILTAGDEVNLQGLAPLEVKLGNAQVIQIWVDGEAYDLSDKISSSNTAFFEIENPNE